MVFYDKIFNELKMNEVLNFWMIICLALMVIINWYNIYIYLIEHQSNEK